MYEVKEITDRSWIVIAEDTNIGLLNKKINGGFVLLAKEAKIDFNNEQELNDFFEADLFKSVSTIQSVTTQKEVFVKGYPTNYPEPIENDTISDLPVFSKRATGGVKFCAGYYCINTDKGWRGSFCPKLSTLNKYEYIGPMKTEEEMKSVLSRQKREAS